MAAYLTWLKQHRGATDETIRRYRTDITRLMPMLGEPSQWDAAALRSAFQRRSKETPGSSSLLVTIMRSYIRFLIVQGDCRPALLHAIPSVQRYRLSALPRHVDPATIEKIIAACPTDRPVEVRDKAIILLLARLGLRAGDVRDMRLDDIDWRGGYIRVKGKTRRPDRLPLPQDVGDAILAYLAAARPKAVEEHLFLRVQAPFPVIQLVRGDRRHRRTHTRARWDRRGADRVAHIPAFACHQPAARGRGPGVRWDHPASQLARDHCHLRQSRSADAHEDRAALARRLAMLNMHISRYVTLHRSLGRKFSEQDRMLRQYAAYAEGFGDRHTQVQRIYDWCHTSSSQYVARRRFDTARNFSLFAHAEDSSHEVPPAGVFGRGKRPRPTPTIIEPDQVRAIMTAALNVPPQSTISPYTYHYLFGLLAATGLRISEALALQCSDLVEDGLIVRNGKFGKQRLIALQPSTRQALEAYLALREKHGARGSDLFVTIRGRAPHKVRAHVVFVRLARLLGYRGPTGTAGMRLHDLRHTFAVRSLESCPPDREAIAHHMAGLSVYLGHVSVANTYWYLEATPVLLRDIAAASEQLYRGEAA
jgi:integrase/recombinase XerD